MKFTQKLPVFQGAAIPSSPPVSFARVSAALRSQKTARGGPRGLTSWVFSERCWKIRDFQKARGIWWMSETWRVQLRKFGTVWAPPVIRWFINPITFSYRYHKPKRIWSYAHQLSYHKSAITPIKSKFSCGFHPLHGHFPMISHSFLGFSHIFLWFPGLSLAIPFPGAPLCHVNRVGLLASEVF